MKVTVRFDLNIDDKEWAEQYPADTADLPANVSRYARNVVQDLFYDLGLAYDDSGQTAPLLDAQ